MSTAAMPLSIFHDEATPSLPTFNFTATTTSPISTASRSSPYRPTNSSPLSSSPIRASSPMSTPPLSPCDPNASAGQRWFGFRDTQSSPISASKQGQDSQQSAVIFGSGGASSSTAGAASKFASRPTRPNPLNLKREAAQESRRKLFLRNVRQRAEDKRWEMRGGDQELLKLEWFSLNSELRSAKNSDLDGLVLDSDIEEAARLREEVMRKPLAIQSSAEPMLAHKSSHFYERGDGYDADSMMVDMVDMLEQEQQAELEAMMSSAPENGGPSLSSTVGAMKPPDSPHYSDDDAEYDALFMDFVNSQGGQHAQDQDAEMDLS